MKQIREMIELMESDSAFEEDIRLLVKSGKVKDVVEAAARGGFTVTENDWLEVINFSRTMSVDRADIPSIYEEVDEEQLESIAGGGPTTEVGDYWNPYISNNCWFWNPICDDAKRCMRTSCKQMRFDGDKGEGWYQCCCFNNGWCVKNIHHIAGTCK